MHIEATILSFMWIFGIALMVVLFIPGHRLQKSVFALLSYQALLWVSTLLHVEFGLVSFPDREFPKATDALFTTAFFFYPLIYAVYVISQPKASVRFRLCYMVVWISGLTVIDHLLETYSNLIVYEHYAWYWAWLNFLILFLLSNLIYKWFFKDKSLFQADRWATK